MVSICTHNKMANICKNIKKKKQKQKTKPQHAQSTSPLESGLPIGYCWPFPPLL